MNKQFRKLSMSALLALATVMALSAQSITTGDIAGTAKDQTGAVIPQAKVTLKDIDKGTERSYTTSGGGEYRFTTLPPGHYQISAGTPGLKSDISAVSISVGQVVSLDLLLKPEASQQVVTVTDTVPLINSENGNLATTFTQKQLENLPAPGNDMTAYAFTTPGVTISTGGGYGNFSAFGLPGVSNLFTINGADNMDPYFNLNNSGASNLTLGSNEITEVAIVLNGYTGQYGRQAGANVNYVTKSGTNEFHGNAGWWYNEKVLNANDWFNNAQGTARPFAVSNQWADSIGGPVIKNKLFFFVNNEGIRYVLPGGGGQIYTPTPGFSKFVLNSVASTNPSVVPFYTKALGLYDNSTGASRLQALTAAQDDTLGCGDITKGTSPGALAAQAAGYGTSLACAGTFRSTVNNLNTEWMLQARSDYNITNTDRIYFRFNTDHGVQATGTDAINPAFNANSVQPQWGGQFGYTKVIGASMVNQLNLSGSYYNALFGPPDLAAALNTFPTTMQFGDGSPYADLGGSDNAYPQGRKVRQWGLVDDFSLSHGKHTIKLGANVRKNWVATYAYGANTSGTLAFSSMTDFLNGTLSPATGSFYSQAFSRIGAENVNMSSAGFYIQDEWKIRPNFTLTAAIRFDRNGNINCPTGCFTQLMGQPFAQAAHSATTPYNASIVTGLKSAFPNLEAFVPAPRVGFAYSPTSSTVIRGGFGIFSDLYPGTIADRLITNAPAVASFTTTSGVAAPGVPNSVFSNVSNSYNAFASGFANGATLAQLRSSVAGFTVPNFNTLASKLYNPKYYEWNFEVQQAFGNKYMLSMNYVGNSGYQEFNSTLFANAYSSKGFGGLPTAAPDPRFGEIRELNNNGFSNYNGLVTSFHWRPTSSFTGQFSYTWSHALDTCSNACLLPYVIGGGDGTQSPGIRYQVSPAGVRNLNYGSADYDARHSLNANYVWNLPGTHLQNSILKTVFGGWTVAGTLFYKTGYPFSVVNSLVRGAQGVSNASGIATQPFLSGYLGGITDVNCTTIDTACFSASSFQTPAAQTTFGNLTRNSFRGPGYFNTDLNINKVFAVRERYRLQIGAYFYNVLNHPNFGMPVNYGNLGNFGTIISTVSAPTSAYGSFQGSAVSGRIIQTLVKFTF